MPPKRPFVNKFKIQLIAGAATPAPPVGPVVGQYGINIQQFCMRFNDGTMEFKPKGYKIPTLCYIFEDKTFELEFKTPPAADLIREMAKIKKGSAKSNTDKVGKITQKQLEEIAAIKAKDLNAYDVKMGARIIAGTARQMGVEVVA